MAEAVYLLCAFAGVLCATLLFRGYRSSRTRLLFWSSLCFLGLAINNLLLVVDLVLVPSVDLSLSRSLVAMVALMVMIFGLVWESR